MSNIRSKIEYDNNIRQFREIRRQQLLQCRRTMNQNCFDVFGGMEVEKIELFQVICVIFDTIDSFFNSANFEYDFINYFRLMCVSNEDFLTSKSFGPNPDFQVFYDLDINLDDVNEYQKSLVDETIYQLPKNSVSIQYIEQYLKHKHLQYTLKNIIEALTIILIKIYVIACKGYNIDLEHLANLINQFIRLC